MQRKMYSYDIFDTILYRKVPKPIDIFYLVEQQIPGSWKAGSFADVRRKTEFWLRRFSRKEITVEDIYEKIGKKYQLQDPVINTIKGTELKTEKEYSILNQTIVDEIKDHIQSGDEVVLISDMYWHEEQIRDWLAEKDEVFNNLPIYISCDYGVTKASGKLYELVKEKEQVDYRSWIHTGDNRNSDGEVPKRLGITCNIVKGGRKYDFEKKIDIKDKNLLDVYGLITEAEAFSNGDAYDLGASVVAPMVYQYVDWVLKQAVEKKIATLYFVLRDGYILKQVADVIIVKKDLPIRTEYIFGSRVAWRFPEITVGRLKSLSVWEKSNWIFRDPAIAYVPLERLGFSKQQVDKLFGVEFGKKELHSFAEFKKILDECLTKKEFVEQLEQNIGEAKKLLNQYLGQTINFNESFALVDTNSTGKTQADLNRMLSRIHPDFGDLRFFYHTFIADNEPDDRTQFVFLNSKEADRRFPEAFFRAPYNQCYGYVEENGQIVPRLHESDKCAWRYSFDYDSYLKGIIEFAQRVWDVDIDEYVEMLLKVVNFDIVSKDEIRQAAKMPFNPDMNGDEVLDFYPKIGVKALGHPFSELIYFPKGSYYDAGGMWIAIYSLLNLMVKLKRR